MVGWIRSSNGALEQQLIVVDAKRFPNHYWSIPTAKQVFAPCICALDLAALEKPDGSPSYYGNVLIKKAISLIQLEISYILDTWTCQQTGAYNREGRDHSRSDIYTDYLKTIDRNTLAHTTLTTDDGTKIRVGALFPIPPMTSFEKKGKSVKTLVVKSHENAITLDAADGSPHDDEEEDQHRSVPFSFSNTRTGERGPTPQSQKSAPRAYGQTRQEKSRSAGTKQVANTPTPRRGRDRTEEPETHGRSETPTSSEGDHSDHTDVGGDIRVVPKPKKARTNSSRSQSSQGYRIGT